MKILYKFLFIFLFSTTVAQANVESWYTYWSVGASNHTYPGELNDIFNDAESLPGVDRTEIAIDMLGFYWPVSNKTILGFVVSGSGDYLSDGVNDVSIKQYLYALSAMHYFGNEPGNGMFLRGDLGASRIVVESNLSNESVSDDGSGYLIGAGYGFSVSTKSRLILGINYSSNSIDNETFTSTLFTVGGLW